MYGHTLPLYNAVTNTLVEHPTMPLGCRRSRRNRADCSEMKELRQLRHEAGTSKSSSLQAVVLIVAYGHQIASSSSAEPMNKRSIFPPSHLPSSAQLSTLSQIPTAIHHILISSFSFPYPLLPKSRLLILNRDIAPRHTLILPPDLVRNLLVLGLLKRRLVALVALTQAILLHGVDAYRAKGNGLRLAAYNRKRIYSMERYT